MTAENNGRTLAESDAQVEHRTRYDPDPDFSPPPGDDKPRDFPARRARIPPLIGPYQSLHAPMEATKTVAVDLSKNLAHV